MASESPEKFFLKKEYSFNPKTLIPGVACIHPEVENFRVVGRAEGHVVEVRIPSLTDGGEPGCRRTNHFDNEI